MKPTGFVFYQGPSALDGAPIVAIVTGLGAARSRNKKTGAELQTWILRADVNPWLAAQSGADASICGACPHRGIVVDGRNVGRTCYVNITMGGPGQVFRAWAGGKYPTLDMAEARELLADRIVRMGSYGDPAAVPFNVWCGVLATTEARTGYTHQWRNEPQFKAWCMASVDSVAEYHEAKAAGWRTFRVRSLIEAKQPREVNCPASKEAGYKATCAECKACGGLAAKALADIVIAAHGSGAKTIERRHVNA